MPDFKPTQEQLDIYDIVVNSKDNILIEALAGTGKTYTLVEVCKLLPKNDIDVTFLAFNKVIADTLKAKLPDNVRCQTTYSAGLGALKRKYKDIEFDEFKADKIIKEKSKKWDLYNEFKGNESKVEKYIRDIRKMVDLCRLTLTLDPKYIPYVCDKYDIKHKESKDLKRIMSVLEILMNDKTSYDFVDMVFIPATDPKVWFFPQDYVLLDEAQDISKCQQRIIEKMIKKDRKTGITTGRLILCGDKNQAIYSFLGSDANSWEWFENYPNIKKIPLSTTFRCSKAVVEEARKLVPTLNYRQDADEGIVRKGDVIEEAQENDFILCRTNAPLVRLFFHFLLKGKKASINGGDMKNQLLEMIGNNKDINELYHYWNLELLNYKAELIKSGVLNYETYMPYVALNDKISTLDFICKLSKSIEDLKYKINLIFNDDVNAIHLLTVHASKGLEADRVFIIHPEQLPMKTGNGIQYKQEQNLCYIAQTRARHELVYDRDFEKDFKD